MITGKHKKWIKKKKRKWYFRKPSHWSVKIESSHSVCVCVFLCVSYSSFSLSFSSLWIHLHCKYLTFVFRFVFVLFSTPRPLFSLLSFYLSIWAAYQEWKQKNFLGKTWGWWPPPVTLLSPHQSPSLDRCYHSTHIETTLQPTYQPTPSTQFVTFIKINVREKTLLLSLLHPLSVSVTNQPSSLAPTTPRFSTL